MTFRTNSQRRRWYLVELGRQEQTEDVLQEYIQRSQKSVLDILGTTRCRSRFSYPQAALVGLSRPAVDSFLKKKSDSALENSKNDPCREKDSSRRNQSEVGFPFSFVFCIPDRISHFEDKSCDSDDHKEKQPDWVESKSRFSS
jgi:hypothetical protein